MKQFFYWKVTTVTNKRKYSISFCTTCIILLKGATVGYGGKVANVVVG